MLSAFGVDHGEISKGIVTSKEERKYAWKHKRKSDYAVLGAGGLGLGMARLSHDKRLKLLGLGMAAGGLGYYANRGNKDVNEYRKKKGLKPRNAWGYVKE